MTHMSHFYPKGCSLYFIFIAKMDSLDEYRAYQRGIPDSIQEHGATVSHHHGIGKAFAPSSATSIVPLGVSPALGPGARSVLQGLAPRLRTVTRISVPELRVLPPGGSARAFRFDR